MQGSPDAAPGTTRPACGATASDRATRWYNSFIGATPRRVRARVIGLAGGSDIDAAQTQPAHAFQQTAQDFPVGRLSMEGEGHDIVDDQGRREQPIALALPSGLLEDAINQLCRNRRCQNPKGHEVADTSAVRQSGRRAGHGWFLRKRLSRRNQPKWSKSTVLRLGRRNPGSFPAADGGTSA